MTDSLTPEELRDVRARLGRDEAPDPTLELSELESLKHAIEARQALLATQVDRELRDRAAAEGVPATRQGRGVAETVAAARRISPVQGRILVAAAKTLRTLPQVWARFRDGDLSEHQSLLIAREAALLEARDQRTFDREVATIPGLRELGTRKIAHRAQAIAFRLDEDAVVRRYERAAEDRHVSPSGPQPSATAWPL